MNNIVNELTRRNISVSVRGDGIQNVRTVVCSHNRGTQAGSSALIKQLLDRDVSFENEHLAIFTAQAVYESLHKSNFELGDPDAVIIAAKDRAETLYNSREFAFIRVQSETKPTGYQPEPTTQVAVVEGLDVKVAVNKEGKIKRGGKKDIVIQLYVEKVRDAEVPMERAEFKKILMDQLGMTKMGSQTYVYNCFADNGEYKADIAAIPSTK